MRPCTAWLVPARQSQGAVWWPWLHFCAPVTPGQRKMLKWSMTRFHPVKLICCRYSGKLEPAWCRFVATSIMFFSTWSSKHMPLIKSISSVCGMFHEASSLPKRWCQWNGTRPLKLLTGCSNHVPLESTGSKQAGDTAYSALKLGVQRVSTFFSYFIQLGPIFIYFIWTTSLNNIVCIICD